MLTVGVAQGYIKGNLVTNGSTNMTKRCQEAQAVTAFLWFGFASFLGSLVFSVLAMRSGLGPSSTGGIRKGELPANNVSCIHVR